MYVLLAFCAVAAAAAGNPLLCENEFCPPCLDVVIVVDRSSSVSGYHWTKSYIPFLQQFSSFPVGDYKFALVTFGTNAALNWNWNGTETANSTELYDAMGNVEYTRGLTNTGAGLQLAREEVIESVHNREECPDYCVVLSNGGTNHIYQTTFDKQLPLFQGACVRTGRVIAVGVGHEPLLNSIASHPSFVVSVETFGQLPNSGFNRIQILFCSHIPCPPCADIAVVVDSSSSVGRYRFNNRIIPFLKNFATTENWTIGSSFDEYLVGVVTFSSSGTLQWQFGANETSNETLLETAFDNLQYTGGFTNTGDGLRVTLDSILPVDNREECADICVVIVNGAISPQYLQDFIDIKDSFKGNCTKVIVLGITTSSADIVRDLATSESYQILVHQWNEVEESFSNVSDAICDLCPPVVPACPMCADIVFVVDGSASVGGYFWRNRIIPFLKLFANTSMWDIGIDTNEYQFATVVFSTTAEVVWNWNDTETLTAQDLATAFDGLSYPKKETNTGEGLKQARLNVIDGDGNRQECTDICIVIANGQTNDHHMANFNAEKTLFMSKCNKVIVVGVGNTIPKATMTLASNDNYRFEFPYSEILDGFQEVANATCGL